MRVERAGAVHLRIERAGDGEEAVADRLGFESARRVPPPQAILRVGFEVGGARLVRLHVDGAGHDQLVDRFELPAVLDQLAGEIIEQLGMRRRIALDAEIVRRADDAAAHVVLPEAIDDDAGEEVAGAIFGSVSQLARATRGSIGSAFGGGEGRISTCTKPGLASSHFFSGSPRTRKWTGPPLPDWAANTSIRFGCGSVLA